MEISVELVKKLRERTGAGIVDCQKALRDSVGELEKAIDLLRERGVVKAAKKSGRATQEGAIASYIHMGGKIGVLLELNCETDFVAKTHHFQDLARNLTLHVAAAAPQWVGREGISAETIEKEKEIYRVQAKDSGKSPTVIEKIAEGKLQKFYAETCLLEQPYVRDPNQTVQQLITEAIAKLGENITVRRFARFQVGQS
ncbi:MAG: translation elongation factor Ts [Deltaproteobacteria bacterium]|nr:translation elongation factor Ts [Deltaproteobacteria bacterium]